MFGVSIIIFKEKISTGIVECNEIPGFSCTIVTSGGIRIQVELCSYHSYGRHRITHMADINNEPVSLLNPISVQSGCICHSQGMDQPPPKSCYKKKTPGK